MQTQRDLFEELREELLCKRISDMKYEPCRTRARRLLSKKDIEQYPLRMLEDVADYFCGITVKFTDYNQAGAFFKG